MTIISIPRVRPSAGGRLPGLSWGVVLAYFVVPLALGWFAFALADSVTNFEPQTIRLSAQSEYDPYLDDFVVFYAAGNVARNGNADGLYDPATLHAAQAAELGVPESSIIRLPFYNPPGVALPLIALSLLTLTGAAVAWTAIQLVLFAASLGAIAREGARRNGILAGLLVVGAVSSMPFHETILHGQVSMTLLAGWVALWFGAFERRSDKLTVLALTLLAIKPQLVIVPVAYLVLTRRWRALAVAAALQAILSLATMLFLDPRIVLHWLQLMLSATRWEDENGIWVHAMFGWNAFVRAIAGSGYHAVRAALATGLTLATAGYCLRAGRAAYRQGRHADLFAMLIFASVVMSPHLFAQDLMLVVAPISLLVLRASGRERSLWLVFGAAGWLLTFLHFDLLMGTPDERAMNSVTLWLATGVVLAGTGAGRRIASRYNAQQEPQGTGPKPPGLPVQLAMGGLVALVLLLLVPGFAGRKLASAIEYSYTATSGPTYRIALPNLARDSSP